MANNNIMYYNYVSENYKLHKKQAGVEIWTDGIYYRVFNIEYKQRGVLEFFTNATMIYSGTNKKDAEFYLA